jgi:DNA polymerase beta
MPPLEERGLIAASLSTGAQKWQGIVRLPEKAENGGWSHRQRRLEAIEKNEGVYRKVDLKYVSSRLLQLFGYLKGSGLA